VYDAAVHRWGKPNQVVPAGGGGDPGSETGTQVELKQEVISADDEAKRRFEEDVKKMPWLVFKHLDGYYHGIKSIVSKAEHIPEYPNRTFDAPLPAPPINQELPKPKVYNPFNTSTAGYKTCYLDANRTIAAPDLYAYDGVPQHFPDPVMGSYELFGIKDDICFDRFGRYGPYGLGYAKREGGTGVGHFTESAGNDEVWSKTGQIDYSNIDWADAQDRCLEANQHRLQQVDPETNKLQTVAGKTSRTAIVIRTYTGFKWTEHSILNFRAMINELSLKTGGEYQLHFLLHVRDTDIPIWADDVTVQRLLDANMPPEFHGMVTLWSEPQMKLFYPGTFGETYSDPSGADIHGVYRSAHFPLQVFAMQHPEYEHFWNWEMDMRYVGSYYEFFDRLGQWAKKQPRNQIWERSARYYIPTYHGSWENFTATVNEETIKSQIPSPFGPLKFPGRKSLRFEAKGESVMPETCEADRENCGVGEEADIITLNPIFDTDGSGWVFGLDATGYAKDDPPPRRSAIITASRMSYRLLAAMHEEVWRHHHTMFSEMFPPSVAFHHGFKGVYAPHPMYIDRAWTPLGSTLDAAFNGGEDHTSGGKGSPFDILNEHNHKGTTWYFHSEFAGLLWRRWLGYPQMDGRSSYGGKSGEGTERGGKAEEEREDSSGRMCLRAVLLHPIKFEHPSER